MDNKISEHQIKEVVSFHINNYLADLEGKEPQQVWQQVLDIVEPVVIETMLDYTGDNQSKAAEFMGINRATLRTKMKRHNLEVK